MRAANTNLRVYEVVGRTSGSYNTILKTHFAVASSKDKIETPFDYVKRVYWRRDMQPSDVKLM
jgi:hypothetical protein